LVVETGEARTALTAVRTVFVTGLKGASSCPTNAIVGFEGEEQHIVAFIRFPVFAAGISGDTKRVIWKGGKYSLKRVTSAIPRIGN